MLLGNLAAKSAQRVFGGCASLVKCLFSLFKTDISTFWYFTISFYFQFFKSGALQFEKITQAASDLPDWSLGRKGNCICFLGHHKEGPQTGGLSTTEISCLTAMEA